MVEPGECSCTITYTTGAVLKENGNAVYGGNVMSIVPDTSTVMLNNKRYLVNNTTGEVLPEKTTLKNSIIFSTKKIVSAVSSVINKTNENFANSDVVEQQSLSIFALTSKGAKKLKEVQQRVLEKLKGNNPGEF